jgi:hypothetical protein
MAQTLAGLAREYPGYEAWAADQRALEAAADMDDLTVLARIVGVFVDRYELPEVVGAIRAAGFRRQH